MEASKQIEDSYPELFPKDFGERLERLRELARLSWEEFAERLSADDDHVMEWRKGSVPSGGGGVAHHSPGIDGSRRGSR